MPFVTARISSSTALILLLPRASSRYATLTTQDHRWIEAKAAGHSPIRGNPLFGTQLHPLLGEHVSHLPLPR